MAGVYQTSLNYLYFFKYFVAYYFAFLFFQKLSGTSWKNQLVYLIWHMIFESIKLVATWAFLQFKINSWLEAKRQTP